MMKRIYIYLSGSIQKGQKDSSSVWTSVHIATMKTLFLEKGIEVIFLNPASRTDDLSDPKSLFGRDLLQVYLSSCVLVDGRDRRGVGIGYEMAVANYKNIPVFSWVTKGSHYNPEETKIIGQQLNDWKHPFVYIPSAKVVEFLSDAVDSISSFNLPRKIELSQDDFIFSPIQYYIETNLKRDKEMYSLLVSDTELQTSILPLTMLT